MDAKVIKARQSRKRKGKDGFKMHANADENGVVKKMTDTPGHVHDAHRDGHASPLYHPKVHELIHASRFQAVLVATKLDNVLTPACWKSRRQILRKLLL